jgi:hypothetical protein
MQHGRMSQAALPSRSHSARSVVVVPQIARGQHRKIGIRIEREGPTLKAQQIRLLVAHSLRQVLSMSIDRPRSNYACYNEVSPSNSTQSRSNAFDPIPNPAEAQPFLPMTSIESSFSSMSFTSIDSHGGLPLRNPSTRAADSEPPEE